MFYVCFNTILFPIRGNTDSLPALPRTQRYEELRITGNCLQLLMGNGWCSRGPANTKPVFEKWGDRGKEDPGNYGIISLTSVEVLRRRRELEQELTSVYQEQITSNLSYFFLQQATRTCRNGRRNTDFRQTSDSVWRDIPITQAGTRGLDCGT